MFNSLNIYWFSVRACNPESVPTFLDLVSAFYLFHGANVAWKTEKNKHGGVQLGWKGEWVSGLGLKWLQAIDDQKELNSIRVRLFAQADCY